MPKVRLGSHPTFEFELTVLGRDEDDAEVRTQAWTADHEGVVWTARREFLVGDLLFTAAPLLSPAVYESGLADRDRTAFEGSALVSGARCYFSHAYPGRLVIGPSVWGGGDVWAVPKHLAATIDIAVPDLSVPSPDPKRSYFSRLGDPLLVRVRDATLVSADEPEWRAPPFVYAVSALDLVGGFEDHWRPTSERGKPQAGVEFAPVAG